MQEMNAARELKIEANRKIISEVEIQICLSHSNGSKKTCRCQI